MEHESGPQHRLRHARLGSVCPAAAEQLRDGEVERSDQLQLKMISKQKKVDLTLSFEERCQEAGRTNKPMSQTTNVHKFYELRYTECVDAGVISSDIS